MSAFSSLVYLEAYEWKQNKKTWEKLVRTLPLFPFATAKVTSCNVAFFIQYREGLVEMNRLGPVVRSPIKLKPGFHIVVSVVPVVRKKIIGQLQLYGNLPLKCSIQLKKRQIQLVVRDRIHPICPMNFFRTTHTTDTTIWKPGLILGLLKF